MGVALTSDRLAFRFGTATGLRLVEDRGFARVRLSKTGYYLADNIHQVRLSCLKVVVNRKQAGFGLGPGQLSQPVGRAGLRNEFEGYAVLAFTVEDEVGVGLGAVAAREAVQHCVLPFALGTKCQLIYDATVAPELRTNLTPTCSYFEFKVTHYRVLSMIFSLPARERTPAPTLNNGVFEELQCGAGLGCLQHGTARGAQSDFLADGLG
jgi:hypothetical protein